MTENRDFLKEFKELRVETNGIRNSLVSKTGNFNNLSFDNGVLKEIVGELKTIRKENKEIKEDIDKKFEEMRSEFLLENQKIRQALDDKEFEIIKLELELFEKNLKIRHANWETEKKNEKEASGFQNNILEEMIKIQTVSKVPIRVAILGEWKVMGYNNFEAYKKACTDDSLIDSPENLKYSLDIGLLKQTGGGYEVMKEGEKKQDHLRLFVENNHVKTVCSRHSTIDRYIEDGKLHVLHSQDGETWKLIYKKI